MDRVTNISYKTVSESRPGYGGSTLITSNTYNTAGQLVATVSLSTRSTRSTRLNSRLYLYDELNERVATASDRNFNNAIDLSGPDLISSNATRYVSIGGDWWRETRQWSIHDDNSAEARLIGVHRSRVTGLGVNGLASESVSIDPRGNATTNRVFRNRASAEEIAWVKYPTSTTPAVTTSTNGLVRSSTSQTGVTTTFAYDAFQREVSQTDGRGNTTRTVYDNFGRVASTIDALGYATTCGYDALGRQVSVTDPLTNTVTTAYDAEGHVIAQRGATYPVDYAYDEFGEKISMTTYRDLNASGDATRWRRDEATGLVTNKVYADGKGPTYTYTPDGKLATRIWARGIVTTYNYDANGALTNTVYSDGTPTISLAYNRAGRQIQAIDAAGVTTFLYDDFGALTNETVVGVAGTNTIERYYDSFGRNAGYALNGVRQSTLAYDPATGRLASMLANGSDTPFTWNYLVGSDLKSSLAYPNGLTASWTYDANGQLLQVKNAFSTNTISQYDYMYDAAGRRIIVSKSGTAFDQNDSIAYDYNEKSELTNAVAAVDAAYRYSYDFDEIGNRESSSERGKNSVYTANNLNQYTAVDDFAPQFDDDGNQTLIKTATGIWSVTYNGENRPVLWAQEAKTTSMTYDRFGRRFTKNDLHFVYDGYLQIADNAGNSYIWDPTDKVATRLLVWNRSYFTAYYSHDGRKNVSEVIAGKDDIFSHYDYAPFGAIAVQGGDLAMANPWRFSSEFAEDDTSTVYFNYRHYEPTTGRWLTLEPFPRNNTSDHYLFVQNGWWNDYLGLRNMISYARVSDKHITSDSGTLTPARELMIYMEYLNKLQVENCKCFEIEIKDLVGARLESVAEDVKNHDKVYIVAHAGLRVNGELWKKEYYTWKDDDKVEEVVDPDNGGEMIPLEEFLNIGIESDDVFGCFVARGYRRVKTPTGEIKSSMANCGALISDLTERLREFEQAQRKSKCKKKKTIIIYEGRKDNGWKNFGTDKAMLRRDGLDEYIKKKMKQNSENE